MPFPHSFVVHSAGRTVEFKQMKKQGDVNKKDNKDTLASARRTAEKVGEKVPGGNPDTDIKAIPTLGYKDIVVSFTVEWDKEESGEFIELDPGKMVVYLSEDADFVVEKVACGDIIVAVNGTQYDKSTDIEEAINTSKKVSLVLVRRDKGIPVPIKRAEMIGLKRHDGFEYLVITVKKRERDPPVKGMGFTAKHVKNKMYICSVLPNSLASLHFAVGDALLDLNGTAVPFSDSAFLANYLRVYQEKGVITAIIERPVHTEAVKMLNKLYLTFVPQAGPDLGMAADAVIIGKEAAKLHKAVMSKLTPRPVLKNPKHPFRLRKAERTKCDDEGGLIKIWPKMHECSIGTDVEEGDLEDLRPVKKKDRSRKKHERGGVFSDFFDLF